MSKSSKPWTKKVQEKVIRFFWICIANVAKSFTVEIPVSKAHKLNYYDLVDMAYAKARALHDDKAGQENTWSNPNQRQMIKRKGFVTEKERNNLSQFAKSGATSEQRAIGLEALSCIKFFNFSNAMEPYVEPKKEKKLMIKIVGPTQDRVKVKPKGRTFTGRMKKAKKELKDESHWIEFNPEETVLELKKKINVAISANGKNPKLALEVHPSKPVYVMRLFVFDGYELQNHEKLSSLGPKAPQKKLTCRDVIRVRSIETKRLANKSGGSSLEFGIEECGLVGGGNVFLNTDRRKAIKKVRYARKGEKVRPWRNGCRGINIKGKCMNKLCPAYYEKTR